MKLLTHRERETLRERFLPKQVRILFIGEAPPASGRFFYSANSGLYRAMRDAFKAAEPRIDDDNFLVWFQDLGCYLTDLYPKPVDRLASEPRLQARVAGEKLLCAKLVRLQPQKIAPVLRAIATHVANASRMADWRGETIELPYPGRWKRNRVEFVKVLRPALLELFDARRPMMPRGY